MSEMLYEVVYGSKLGLRIVKTFRQMASIEKIFKVLKMLCAGADVGHYCNVMVVYTEL